MRKIKRPQIGEYVLATRWGDRDPLDPWYVGFVTGIIETSNGMRYLIGGSLRHWRNIFRISKEEGAEWLKNFSQQAKERHTVK